MAHDPALGIQESLPILNAVLFLHFKVRPLVMVRLPFGDPVALVCQLFTMPNKCR